jgi:hypothetical protein
MCASLAPSHDTHDRRSIDSLHHATMRERSLMLKLGEMRNVSYMNNVDYQHCIQYSNKHTFRRVLINRFLRTHIPHFNSFIVSSRREYIRIVLPRNCCDLLRVTRVAYG